MPSGIEEALAAVAAAMTGALEAGAALSPLAGVPDPAGSAMDAGDAAAFGAHHASPSADALDGDPSVLAASSSSSGSESAPLSGDRPPDGSSRSGVTVYDFEPMDIIAGKGEAAGDPADAAADTPPSPPPPDPPAPPAPDATGGQNAAPPGLFVPQPPGLRDDSQAPPAGEREPGAPQDLAPPSAPENEPGPWAAGLADRWEQNVTYTWSGLLFGESGEETNQRAKQAMEDWLTENLLDDDLDQSEGERITKAVLAGVLKSAADVGLDMVVTPVLDPGTIPRGIMRTGVASSEGLEDIQQGRTLEGTLKIVGEVSGTVLLVLTPVRAGGVKRVGRTGPQEPSIALSLERVDPKSRGAAAEAMTAHNVVEVQQPNAPVRRSHAVAKAVGEPGSERSVAQALKYKEPVGDTYDSFTRPMTPAEAQKAIGAMDRALQSNYGGVPGGVGPFGKSAEHCATHAAAVAQAGGVWTTGRLGPHVNFYLFKYMSPPGAQHAAAVVAQSARANDNYPR